MAAVIEFIHALLMVVFVIAIPFLFIRKWKWLTITSAIYSTIFIVVNRISHWVLGECILTRLARLAGGAWDGEWFVVKLSRTVFGFIPSNRQVVYLEQAAILVVCGGILVSFLLPKVKNEAENVQKRI